MHRAAVDAVLQRDRAEAALREHLHRLRVAVGVVELEVDSSWISASSSGKTKPQPVQPSDSSGVHASVLLAAWA